MKLSLKEIQRMNEIQLEIFRAYMDVCNKLGLKYYMVHGSLLGAVRMEGFMPYDDDIDVAMPRKDYETLIRKGQALLPKHLFLQSYQTDPEFPLAFAKIRNSNTTFSQTIMKNLKINGGIYIDVFPVDHYPTSRYCQRWMAIKERFYGIRVSDRLFYEEKQPAWKKALRMVIKTIYPSWKKAVEKRANLYVNVKHTGFVITVGGKALEKGIPEEWFGSARQFKFDGLRVDCPEKTEEYLEQIYGDYSNYDPMGKYMNPDGTVMVSAERFSVDRPFTQ